MRTDRLIILGNGGAAINAVKAIRSAGHEGDIHMISDSSGPAFNPMLAPYYLKNIIPWENCFPFGIDFYKQYDVKCYFGSPVVFVDTLNRIIVLKNEKRLHYDKCLIATGASPIMPPVPGLRDSAKALPLRTALQTKTIESAIPKAKKVAVMGASLVGVKLAEILRKKGLEVILLDIAPNILPQGSHPKTAEFLRKYIIQQGIDLRLSCNVEYLEETQKGFVCPFPEGEEEIGFIAVCAGIKPNIAFINSSSISVDQAILVDEKMRTSTDGLYAAGDVCQGYNPISGKQEWLGTWVNACCQGRTAGLNMAGSDAIYQGNIPQHISPLFDWSYAQIGDIKCNGNHKVISKGDPFKGEYCLLVFKKDILVGANLINCTEKAGIIRNAILRKTNLRTKGLLKPFSYENIFYDFVYQS
ncbi:MAG: FAD-dependent oxidoreductase [Deltaproteobacteria bacterium]|nr:FAD-dependent oxidoreductase [Deltaproteobacteria bacterium]